MQTYRVCVIDDNSDGGALKILRDFEATDDGDALRTAARLVDGNAVVLWEGNRLIGMLKPAERKRARSFDLMEHAAFSH